MMKNSAEVIICLIFVITTAFVIFINKFTLILIETYKNFSAEFGWIIYGLQNMVGYSTVFLPGYITYKYIYNTNYLEISNNGCLSSLLRKCFGGYGLIEHSKTNLNVKPPQTFLQGLLLLLFYFVGLQTSFLTWGVLQEKIMTQNYTNVNGNIEHFTNSQFLVFVNRILAFFMSSIIILSTKQPNHKAPLYKYVFCSFSNILSSWCQYEALKYVSFLHQVLAKSAKIIPVLIMGRIITKIKYEFYEYITVVMFSCGMVFFMLNVENDNINKSSAVTTISGLILLCSYLIFDSFTSNWQGALFKGYGMSPIQMMCFVNMFSFIFTAVSLLQDGEFVSSVNFMLKFPSFMLDCFLLSLCSAAGQVFIYRTIASFGPLVFAIITTIRQGLSVLLSCLIYGHQVHAVGVFGLFLIFFSVFLRIYCAYRTKSRHRYLCSDKI